MGKKIDIDWAQVRSMLLGYCSGQDIADALGIDSDTLYNRCAKENKITFAELKAQCRATTRQQLRQAQIKRALGFSYEAEERSVSDGPFGRTTTSKTKQVKVLPDSTMLIFLGKNMLGQTDKLDVTNDIPGFVILGDTPDGTDDLDD